MSRELISLRVIGASTTVSWRSRKEGNVQLEVWNAAEQKIAVKTQR